MSLQTLDLTTALRPSLLPEEILLFVQDTVGLYEGYADPRVSWRIYHQSLKKTTDSALPRLGITRYQNCRTVMHISRLIDYAMLTIRTREKIHMLSNSEMSNATNSMYVVNQNIDFGDSC